MFRLAAKWASITSLCANGAIHHYGEAITSLRPTGATSLSTLLVVDLLLTVALIVFLVLTHPGAELSFKGESEEIEYTLYVGLNDKDTYVQTVPTDEARAIVDGICLKHVDGFTVSEAQGGWTDDEGVIVRENALVYVFYGADEAQITAIMDEVLIALNQSSVLMRKETVQTTYYSGGE